jgi:sugar phosphate isomerase/epimerase
MNSSAAFGINSYSYTFDHTAHEFLDKFANRGYREFELMIYPGHLWPKDMAAQDRRELRQRIERLGVAVVTLNMPNIDVNIAAASDGMRAYSVGLLEGIVQLAGDLGVPGVIVGPGKANPLFPMPREQLMGYFYAGLDRLLPVADRAGTSLYVENMPFAFLPGIDELLAALDGYGRTDIGIVYDVANGHFIKEDITYGLRRCAKQLQLVHISDTGPSLYRHDAVGLGTLPFAVVPPVIEEIGHARLPMLEIISADADRGIEESVRRLIEMGYGKTRALTGLRQPGSGEALL